MLPSVPTRLPPRARARPSGGPPYRFSGCPQVRQVVPGGTNRDKEVHMHLRARPLPLVLSAVAAGALVVSLTGSSPATADRSPRARSVIFINGDGMGAAQRS